MKVLLLAIIFLGISISSLAQDGYIETPSLGKTPIYTGAYTIPPKPPVIKQQEKGVTDNKSKKISRILNKNNEWTLFSPDKISIHYDNGDYLGFFTFNQKDKSVITIYDELSSFLLHGITDDNDVARIDSLIKANVAK